jgi:hypothetical protein
MYNIKPIEEIRQLYSEEKDDPEYDLNKYIQYVEDVIIAGFRGKLSEVSVKIPNEYKSKFLENLKGKGYQAKCVSITTERAQKWSASGWIWTDRVMDIWIIKWK